MRCPLKSTVERVVLNALAGLVAPLPPNIRAFGDWLWHRSEPDGHFQEKPIHPTRHPA